MRPERDRRLARLAVILMSLAVVLQVVAGLVDGWDAWKVVSIACFAFAILATLPRLQRS